LTGNVSHLTLPDTPPSQLASNSLFTMPARRKLASDVVQRIEDLFRCELNVNAVAETLNGRVSKAHLYRMNRKLSVFGSVRPPPICK